MLRNEFPIRKGDKTEAVYTTGGDIVEEIPILGACRVYPEAMVLKVKFVKTHF